MKRESLFFFGRGDKFSGILYNDAAAEQKAEKGADGGQLAADGNFFGVLLQPGPITPEQQVVNVLSKNSFSLFTYGKCQQLRQVAAIGSQSVRRDGTLGVEVGCE